MATGSGADEGVVRDGAEENGGGGSDRRTSAAEDLATRLTRGVVDGFTEASQAFSNELEGTNRIPDLVSRSAAAMIRANARLLDELATAVRQAAVGWRQRPRRATEEDFDYERLADLVAARIRANAAGSDVVESGDPRSSRPAK
jgi:hypothetical protein